MKRTRQSNNYRYAWEPVGPTLMVEYDDEGSYYMIHLTERHGVTFRKETYSPKKRDISLYFTERLITRKEALTHIATYLKGQRQ